MCDPFGTKKANKKAEAEAERQIREAREREEKRAADIRTGESNINEAFSQFDDDFFGNFRNTFQANFAPQVQDQFSDARGRLVSALANRGVLDSSIGANAIGDLSKRRGVAETDIANRGFDAANSLRSTVENTKSNLFNFNLASADPQAVNSRAVSNASAVAAPQSFDPLGDLFSSVLTPFTNFVSADRNSVNPQLPFNRATFATGAGSGRVVR